MLFDCLPIDFKTDEQRQEEVPKNNWGMISGIILNAEGENDLKKAINKVYEVRDYEKLVYAAFSKGMKPPLQLSHAEKNKILQLINFSEIKIRKGILSQNMQS